MLSAGLILDEAKLSGGFDLLCATHHMQITSFNIDVSNSSR